ncbi:MAG: aminotransferase class I/II-fold pyridoxal phosphate-dependent enzyme [Butyrivibrio sp.]|nr:aminotransferase class I/II-fold pyridoxal phosphate-dependent enzyme [Butyrivibrio sp.]
MQAIILAAGRGRRLKERTAYNTKCMVELNGVTLIERALRILDGRDIDKITIVCGYRKSKLKNFVASLGISAPISFVDNPDYDSTNNIYSLGLALQSAGADDTVVMESDIVFERAVLQKLLDSEGDCVAMIAKPEPWMDGDIVTIDGEGRIDGFIGSERYNPADYPSYYKTVSMYRFSRKFIGEVLCGRLDAYMRENKGRSVYEAAIRLVSDFDISTVRLCGERWYEINDIQDIDIAETIFASGTERLKKYQRRFGGYWRYQGMKDFCYLVNPFFPNDRLINEMSANFNTLIREYPSGMAVNSFLAANYFGVRSEQICVGNGTAELIKSLMENHVGKIGMAYPTFEEYPHRKRENDIIPFYVADKDFDYTADDVMGFYEENPVEAIVLVNPDNPTGHFIMRGDILRMEEWARGRDIKIIVDESFVDFARTDGSQTLLDAELLDKHPNLVVIKSISKSFGVAGLRLGVLASADRELIRFMKKDVAIWNINSFAEYYMQIISKYRADYEKAMERFMEVRERYLSGLAKIEGLKVYPSQANYVMCLIEEKYTSTELADILLNRYNILIKDLSSKDGLFGKSYIRLSVKTDEENDAMVKALEELFGTAE